MTGLPSAEHPGEIVRTQLTVLLVVRKVWTLPALPTYSHPWAVVISAFSMRRYCLQCPAPPRPRQSPRTMTPYACLTLHKARFPTLWDAN